MVGKVDPEMLAIDEGWGWLRRRRPPEIGPYPGEKFVRLKRFDDIIVRPGVEHADLVVKPVPHRRHHHRNVRERT